MLKLVFFPFEPEDMGGIRLTNRLPKGRQIWSKTTNGLFSIRSAYKVVLDLDRNDVGGSTSDVGSMCLFWRKTLENPSSS